MLVGEMEKATSVGRRVKLKFGSRSVTGRWSKEGVPECLL